MNIYEIFPDAKIISIEECKPKTNLRFRLAQGEQITLQVVMQEEFNGRPIDWALFKAADDATLVKVALSALVWEKNPKYNESYIVKQVVRGKIYILA